MKKNKLFVLVLAVLSAQLVFSQQTETRKLSSFSKLFTSGQIDVLVQKGSEESVKIVAKGIGTARVITETSNNELHIYLEDGDYRDINVKVYVTYNEIKTLDKSGQGNLEWLSDLVVDNFDLSMNDAGNCNFKGNIKTGQFNLVKTGSGNLNLTAVESNNATFSMTGSGNLTVGSGAVEKQVIELAGTASMSAPGFRVRECNASIHGSGNIEVSVSDLLEGQITGSGNIIYNGNARVNKKTVTGSGKITKRS